MLEAKTNQEETEEKLLILVDGNSLMNRAYYGLAGRQNLTAPDGTPTAAIYAFLNMLFSYLDRYSPEDLVVCFDRPEPGFRHQLYKDYKSGRSAMPDDLCRQMPLVKKALDLMGYARLEEAGEEADDLIATLTTQALRKGSQVKIISGDRDLWQLIGKKVQLIFPVTRQGERQTDLMDEAGFRDKYGLEPEQLLDLKAIMGDSSDRIPGVPGIGEKGALALMQEFGSLEAIYEHLEQLSGARKKRLEEGKELAFLSRELARLKTDSPIPAAFDTGIGAPREDELREFLSELAMNSFLKRFSLDKKTEKEVLSKPRGKKIAAVWDFFPDGEGARLAISWTEKGDFVLADETGNYCLLGELELRSSWPQWKERFSEIVVWDGKAFLRHFDLERSEKAFFDCLIAAYLLGQLSNSPRADDFARALQASTGLSPASAADDETERNLTERAQALFAMADAQKRLLAEEGQSRLLEEIELPLAPVLAEMERAGVCLDRGKLQALSQKLAAEIQTLETEIFAVSGTELNLNSSKQLGVLLFDQLGLKGGKKKKDGSYSTAAEELERLKAEHAVIALIIKHRELSKLRSTFVEGLDKAIAADGRIHSNFNQTLTTTGRLSSSSPNLQNIPVKSDRASEIRDLFTAGEGLTLLDADYSQIELRLLAHLSEEENLLKLFAENKDIHAETAARIFHKQVDAVSARERRAAKTVNFSIVYGISDFGLAQDLGISVKEAKHYIESWHRLYPRVQIWMNEELEFAKKYGYVKTMLGRRRYIAELKSQNYQIRQFGQRAAMNAPVQGSAADLIKIAMVEIDRELKAKKYRARLILQVHDELLLEAAEEEAVAVAEIMRRRMEGAILLSVPLLAEVHMGRSWEKMQLIEQNQ